MTADKNPQYGTEAGNATEDKVFLLSSIEAERYFDSDSERQCHYLCILKRLRGQMKLFKDLPKNIDYFFLRASGYVCKPLTAEKIVREMENLRNPVEWKEEGMQTKTFGKVVCM